MSNSNNKTATNTSFGGGGSGRGRGGASFRGRGRGGGGGSSTNRNQQNQPQTQQNDRYALNSLFTQDKNKCKEFLQGFQVLTKDGINFQKYMVMMKEVYDRKRKLFEIDLDDVQIYTKDREFVSRIEGNTMSYIRIFTQALEEIMPDRNFENESLLATLSESSDSVVDLIMAHRIKSVSQDSSATTANSSSSTSPMKDFSNNSTGNQKKTQRKKNEHLNVLPPDLLRCFELIIIPRRSQQFNPTKIREIKSEHVGHLITLEGIVTRVTEVKPMVTVAAYTCDSCSAEWFQEITSREFMPILMCHSNECFNNSNIGSLTLQSRGSKFIKFQEIKIQEKSDNVPIGHTPRTIKVFVRGELTRQVSPGDIVTLFGVFLPTPYSGHKAIRAGLLADTYVEAMRIVQHKKTYEQYQMTKEMEETLNTLVKEDVDIYERMASSIAPEIYGHLDVKKALLLQMIGAAVKKMPDGMNIRGDINICLMGDPGVAKSQLLKHIAKIAPRGIYTSGKGSSGVGLTAAVIKDTVTNDYVLEGGSLVLADMGICCIDEFDKMEESDRTAIHEVMEQQTISIAKAGITTTLNARTSVLAAANPAFGRYNFKKKPDENFNLPPSLLSRFDLLFLIVDRPDLEKDRLLSEHVTFVHQNTKPPATKIPSFEPELIRCYVSKARRYEPYVPVELTEFIVESYVTMRKQEQETKDPFTYTTARTLLGILRLAQAHARCRMKETVDQSDVEEAMRLMWESKASIRIEKVKKKPVDPIAAIYAIMRDYCTNNSVSSFDYSTIEPMILTAGYNKKQLDRCIDEYQDMNIFMVNSDRSKITIVGFKKKN